MRGLAKPVARQAGPGVKSLVSVAVLCASLIVAGCVPVPVSTVPLHPREERRAAVEGTESEKSGTFSAPVFDASGALIAAYDSGSNRVSIFRSSDLTPVMSLKPTRRPRRLSFSPGGHFLVIEPTRDGLPITSTGSRHLPGSMSIRRKPSATIFSGPRSGTLRPARRFPILPAMPSRPSNPRGDGCGHDAGRSLRDIGARRFWRVTSADETEFSMLCWDGVTQRWDARGWGRLENIPSPPFWRELMSLESARSLTGNDVASRSADGRIAVLRVRQKSIGFGTTYIWDRTKSHGEQVPGECAARLQPVYALSSDGRRVVLVCNKGLGYTIRVWDLGLGHELALKGTDFGIVRGAPTIRGEGVALSPDGRYLAAALLNLSEALLVTPIPAPLAISRSDLRVWSLDDGREVASVPIDDLAVYAEYFRGVDLASPDSTMLVAAGKRMRIYRLSELGASR